MLTMLPLLAADKAKNVGRHYLEDPKSVFSEAIRTARTGVLLSTTDTPNLTVLVTSSVPDEGKTAVAINLALAEAQYVLGRALWGNGATRARGRTLVESAHKTFAAGGTPYASQVERIADWQRDHP